MDFVNKAMGGGGENKEQQPQGENKEQGGGGFLGGIGDKINSAGEYASEQKFLSSSISRTQSIVCVSFRCTLIILGQD